MNLPLKGLSANMCHIESDSHLVCIAHNLNFLFLCTHDVPLSDRTTISVTRRGAAEFVEQKECTSNNFDESSTAIKNFFPILCPAKSRSSQTCGLHVACKGYFGNLRIAQTDPLPPATAAFRSPSCAVQEKPKGHDREFEKPYLTHCRLFLHLLLLSPPRVS